MTFVSVNKATGSVHDLSELGIGSSDRLPFLQSDPSEEAFQGSHTLPRALSAKKSKKTSQPDHVIITSRPADHGGNSVRIQIGGAQAQQQQPNLNMNEKSGKSKGVPSLNNSSIKRKYSLKEVEIEGLLSSSEEGEDVMTVTRDREVDQDEDMFDLNSLIEGAVDDDEEEDENGDVRGQQGALDNSQMYFRPVRDNRSQTPKSTASGGRLQRVEDDQEWIHQSRQLDLISDLSQTLSNLTGFAPKFWIYFPK